MDANLFLLSGLWAAMLLPGLSSAQPSQDAIGVAPAANPDLPASSMVSHETSNAPGTGIKLSEPDDRAARFKQISAGGAHTCGVTQAGVVQCWGGNEWGQLGDGTLKHSKTPVDVVGLNAPVASISSGLGFSCAVLVNGKVQCWGINYAGQLGDSTTKDSSRPVEVNDVAGALVVAAGDSHGCAVLNKGTVKCWGRNAYGQLGNDMPGRSGAVEVKNVPPAVSVVAGFGHSCALTKEGSVWCWGSNKNNQLGRFEGSTQELPHMVQGIARTIKSISTSAMHTCAVSRDGMVVYFWGKDFPPLTEESTSHFYVNAGGSQIASVATGLLHTCVLIAEGRVSCFGANPYGQLALPVTQERLPKGEAWVNPEVAGLQDVLALTANNDHSCVLERSGKAKCWGWNEHGQLGSNSVKYSVEPVVVQYDK